MSRILIIDDDAILCMLLSGILKKSGYDVFTANNGSSGLNLAENKKPDLVITDYQMPDYTGLEVLAELKRSNPELPVILLTAHGDVTLTVKAIQGGAFDFIEKPINPKEILDAISNGLKVSERSKSLSESISAGSRKSIEENLLVGKTPVMRDIFKNIGRVSMNNVNVLIVGEPGTGKERVARMIHYSGISRDHPFISINCNTSSEEELEKELFGGADARIKGGMRTGKLHRAGQGTIFLNDIAKIPPRIQTRLFNTIQENQFHTEGEQPPFAARIISASSQDVDTILGQQEFMNELIYQLNVFSFQLPPLRERLEDMSELVGHLMQQLNRSLAKKISKIDDGVITLLQSYHWPGNVRELKNIIMQAMILAHGDVLEAKHVVLPQKTSKHTAASSQETDTEDTSPPASLADIEKEHIRKVLDYTGWNKQDAAGILGITRPTLNAKIDKYDLA